MSCNLADRASLYLPISRHEGLDRVSPQNSFKLLESLQTLADVASSGDEKRIRFTMGVTGKELAPQLC
eukprot:m.312089 g.312089  ORF g.312089 m.312089 type:complete len:68 (-) comp15964_c0_seq4:5723-5926(-)